MTLVEEPMDILESSSPRLSTMIYLLIRSSEPYTPVILAVPTGTNQFIFTVMQANHK